MKNLTLITGGVRSGKSRLAETLANGSGRQVYYLATMPRILGDREQDERINRHKARRPKDWTTIECPYTLTKSIEQLPAISGCALIDCLSLFISNILVSQKGNKDPYSFEDEILQATEASIKAIKARTDFNFILVTNEVGFGVVPDTSLGRAFRDFLGVANQMFAQEADEVWLTCAGLPLKLKPDLATTSLLSCQASTLPR